MAGNGGIIGPTKVISTPSTRTETFTSSGTFQKTTAPVLSVSNGSNGFIDLANDGSTNNTINLNDYNSIDNEHDEKENC